MSSVKITVIWLGFVVISIAIYELGSTTWLEMTKSVGKFSSRNILNDKNTPARLSVCLMLPVTSRGITHNKSIGIRLSDLPLVHSFIPSLIETMEDDYDYRLYIGYDYGDPWYDNANNWHDLAIFIKSAPVKSGRYKMDLYFRAIILYGIDQRITAVWNTIAAVARKDVCDYFYPANDDLKLITKGWTTAAIQALKSCPVASNFGIATFKDIMVCSIPTFHLVHKTHLDLHNGLYYPVPSHGAAQDPWIYSLYRPWGCAFVLAEYKIKNHIGLSSGPRYDYADRTRLDQWIQRGRRELYNRLSTLNRSRFNQSFVNSSLLSFDLNWDTPC